MTKCENFLCMINEYMNIYEQMKFLFRVVINNLNIIYCCIDEFNGTKKIISLVKSTCWIRKMF